MFYVDDEVFIQPIPMSHAFDIQWFVNDNPIEVSGNTFSISSLDLPVGFHYLRVEIVDPTPWVRDEEARDSIMTQVVTWAVQIDEVACPADVNGNGVVNVIDLLAVIDEWGTCNGCSADINGDNQVNITDLLAIIDAWGNCP